MRKFTVLVFSVFFVLIPILSARQKAEKSDETGIVDPGQLAVTRHTVTIDRKTIAYTATAGMLPIRDEKGKTTAHIFYIAYTRDGVTDLKSRPLLFSFNGGPGSCSVWMHMGFLGPRRVAYDEEGFMLKPPFRLVDNDLSILDEADLVFIDPVATGYSRMAPGEDPHKYHGVMEDIASVGEFIRLYITRNQRWLSPKFIIGESYGTTRAAGLSQYLQGRHRLYINGTVLVSGSCITLGVQPGDDLSLALALPHYAATARYHGKLPSDLQTKPLNEVLSGAEAFALGPYAGALALGNDLNAQEKKKLASELSRWTGLDPDYLLRMNLRVDPFSFRRELLRAEGKVVGRLDSRYTAPANENSTLSPFDADPAMSAWSGPFTAVINQYLQEELKYRTDLVYHIFGDVRPWKGMFEARTGEMLNEAMIQNPYLQVLVLAGYYDGGTDYFSEKYAFTHLDPGGINRERVHFSFFECGHMMYIRKSDLERAKADLAAFIRKAK